MHFRTVRGENPKPELELQLVGDALLAPEGIVGGHASDQLTQVDRDCWSSRARLQAPQQPKAGAMPPNECVGTHYD
jgi:hypothetical protein